jgi:SAM-dependent methyltransferase
MASAIPSESGSDGPGASGASVLDDLAARAAAAVADRRGARGVLGWLDRKLREGAVELWAREGTPEGVKSQLLADTSRFARLLQLDKYWLWRIGKMIEAARLTRNGKPVRVLDLGAGTGDLLFAIEKWAQKKRIPVELTGVDASALAVEAAKRQAGAEGHRVQFRHGDARALDQIATGGVDVAVTTFMLHHLPPGDVGRVLAELDRVAAFDFFAFDLRRNVAAMPALWAVLRVGRFEAPTRHEQLASVRRGYTVDEVEEILRAAGVPRFHVQTLPPAFFDISR